MISRAHLQDDGGMTLIEIVIATAVLGIILPTIMGAFLLGFLESDATRDRVTDSAAAQLTSTYLIGDIQSAQKVWLSKSDCRPAPFTAADPVRLQLDLIDPATNVPSTVSYIDRKADGSSQRELHRVVCQGATTSALPLISNLAATTATFKAVEISCDGSATCPNPEPKNVKVRIRTESTAKQAGSSYLAYDIRFDVHRRAGS